LLLTKSAAFSQELGARVPLLIKVPWLRATSGGKTTAVLAELISIYPTLAALTGTAAALSEEHLDGESLADLFTDPARAPADDDADENAAFSQYIRCHNMSQPAYDNDNLCVPDNKTEGVETIMGYSIRVRDWRYTAWMRWDYETSCAVWTGADGGVHARELYDHAGDDGTDYDKFENKNEASDPANAAVVSKLHARIVSKFGHCLSRHPPPPPSSHLRCRWDSNTEIVGGDLEKPAVGRSASDKKACEDLCKQTVRCRGFTFETNSAFACGAHCCFLKATVKDSMKHKKQGAESGQCEPKLVHDPLPRPAPCSSDEGCQLNGVCKSGSCVCHSGWKGFDCGALDLIPGPPPQQAGLLGNGSAATGGILSTWGGAVVQGREDKKYHMWAAAMLGGCGIKQWGSNSESKKHTVFISRVQATPEQTCR
jgi:iduronate 2-sulfatase